MNKLYSGEVEITLSPAHRYKVIDRGEIVKPEGVTTVLGRVTAKTGLISWAANMAAESFREAISGAVADGVDIDTDFLEECLKTAKNAHNVKRDKGASIGSLVHTACEDYINNILTSGRGSDVPGLSDKQASAAFESFLDWDTRNNPEYIFSEKMVYSRTLRYCGTADVAFTINGKKYLGDFKTSDPKRQWIPKLRRYGSYMPYPEHWLQVAAYDYANREECGEKYDGYMILYITKSGGLHIFKTDETERWINGWRNAISLSRLLKEHS